jgi:hypothetical protein
MGVPKELLEQSSFPGLPWSCKNDGGELAAGAFQNRIKRSGNELSLHGGPRLMQLCISNANLQKKSFPISKHANVNEDGKIGLSRVLYVLKNK